MALIVGLTGVDGAGKSAAARETVQRLQAAGERVLYHHELEMVFFRPIYRVLTAPLRGRSDAARDRFVGASRQPGLASDAYFLLLWVDSLVAYLAFRLRPGIVVHDRWLYDQFALMDRMGYHQRFVRWLYARFPRPDRLVLLTVTPEVAMARKASDPGHVGDRIGFFEAASALIRRIADRYHADAVIDADAPLDRVVTELVDVIRRWRQGERTSIGVGPGG